MATPASFRRLISYQIINDYITNILNKENELYQRKSYAETLPGFVIAILQKINPQKLKQHIEKFLKTYSKLINGKFELPDIKDLLPDEWYVKCIERNENEDIELWIEKIAICSLAILSYASIEEAIFTLDTFHKTLY